MGKNDADSWSDTSSDAASKLISEENFDDFEQNYALKIVDYNDDGFDDLVVLNKSSNEIFFVMNPNVKLRKKLRYYLLLEIFNRDLA